MNWKIPLYKIATDNDDIKNIKKVLERKMDWAIGPEIEKHNAFLRFMLAIHEKPRCNPADLSAEGDKMVPPK